MKYFKGYNPLIIIISLAVVSLAFGFLVLNRNSNPSDSASQSEDEQTEQPPTNNPSEEESEEPVSVPSDWKVYSNTKYGYELKYPPNLKVGTISGNSALGTFDSPVRGFDVGPLVFVSLTGELRQEGADYFNQTYNYALNPPKSNPGEPSVECKIEKINNSEVAVKAVSCTGEGGPARYALITGTEYDVFVDGFSKGFDESNNGEFSDPNDYIILLATFKFGTTTKPAAQPPPTPDAGAETSIDAPPPSLQSFTVNADDTTATPSEITVPIGTIVNLTFSVSTQNVYYGGLEFKSPVVNTGTISAGSSKTIAFTATKSFEFTPYWPASGVKKDYTVKVTVQ